MHSVRCYWKPGLLLVFDNSCPLGECCRSGSYWLEVLRLGFSGQKTYTKIQLHAQSCDELQAEWNGNVLDYNQLASCLRHVGNADLVVVQDPAESHN